MDWEIVKEHLRLAYAKTAQFILYQNLVLYITGCIIAGQPLGPARYTAFLYRIFTFK